MYEWMNVSVLMGQVLFSYKSLFLRRAALLKNHKTDDSRISYTGNNDYYYYTYMYKGYGP